METDTCFNFHYTNPQTMWTLKKDKETGVATVSPGTTLDFSGPAVMAPITGDSWAWEDHIKYELGSRIITFFKTQKKN